MLKQVVVDTRYTDTASSMSTGCGDVPRYICVRPGTDGALLAAMANVIYRRESKGSDIDAKNNEDYTPLDYESKWNKRDISKYSGDLRAKAQEYYQFAKALENKTSS